MSSYAIGIDIYGNIHNFELNYANNIWCDYKKLKSLKVYDEDNEIKKLFCNDNQLESLTIIGGKNIESIDCDINKLKELDLSMCENLKHLVCDFELENNIKLPNHQLKCIYY